MREVLRFVGNTYPLANPYSRRSQPSIQQESPLPRPALEVQLLNAGWQEHAHIDLSKSYARKANWAAGLGFVGAGLGLVAAVSSYVHPLIALAGGVGTMILGVCVHNSLSQLSKEHERRADQCFGTQWSAVEGLNRLKQKDS